MKVRLVETAKGGLLTFRVEPDSISEARAWLKSEYAKKHWQSRIFEIEPIRWFQRRTYNQEKLLRALEHILAFESYREHGWEATVHEELLRIYAPRLEGRIAKTSIPKRTSAMNTVEMSQVIEGCFREIAMHGVGVTDPSQICSYWREWLAWRGTQAVDPLSKTYQDIQDYMQRQTFCEACMKYVGAEAGWLAHIVSSGAGGSDELWNRIRLCDECHAGPGTVGVQHQGGWDALIARHPHIGWRVVKARERAGVPAVEVPVRGPDLIEAGGGVAKVQEDLAKRGEAEIAGRTAARPPRRVRRKEERNAAHTSGRGGEAVRAG